MSIIGPTLSKNKVFGFVNVKPTPGRVKIAITYCKSTSAIIVQAPLSFPLHFLQLDKQTGSPSKGDISYLLGQPSPTSSSSSPALFKKRRQPNNIVNIMYSYSLVKIGEESSCRNYILRFINHCKSDNNYLLTYDSYVPLYNRFHWGE